MEWKESSYLRLEVVLTVKCDLLELNNLSCLKKILTWISALGFLKLLQESWKYFNQRLSFKNLSFQILPQQRWCFPFAALLKIYDHANMKTFKKICLSYSEWDFKLSKGKCNQVPESWNHFMLTFSVFIALDLESSP